MNPGKCKTILLVEDEAIIAMTEKKILEKYGYNIIVANSGEEAIEIVQCNNNIDLILMDIDLGSGIDGTETAIIILSEKTIPVVFLSSHTEHEILEKTEKITSYGYVVKNSGNTVLSASIKMAFKLFEANRQILESEIIQKAMISNISDVIGIISSDGILKYKSTNIEKWFGWEPGDLVGKDYRIPVHPEDTERIEKEFLKLLLIDNQTVSVEFRYRCKNNIYKWVELTAVNCLNNAAINGVLVNFHNITERKQAEEAVEKRIIALTRPLVYDTAISFKDLFNIEHIQRIQDEFAAATMVASIITHPDGTPITRPSNFTRLCDKIVRRTEAGRFNCYKSDSALGTPNEGGPMVQPCLSGGLWDAGASITIGGHHIANWLIGQVRDETQTDEAMLAYARDIGADETDFINAFHEVPSMSQDQFHKVAQSLYTLANQLSNAAYQNVEQARFINERKRIEEQLLENERNLRLITDNMHETVWLMDMNLNITWMSPSVEKIRGYSLEELAGFSLDQHLTKGSFTGLMQTVAEVLIPEKLNDVNDDITIYLELEFCRKDGSTFWGDVFATVLRDSEGKPSGILCTGRDISEQKAADKALRDSEMRFSYAMEATSDGLYDMNLETGEIYCNSRYYNMIGYELYEIPPSIATWESMLYPDDKDYAMSRLMELLSCKDEFMEMEYRLKTKSGNIIWVLDRSKIVEYDISGKPLRIVGTHIDISERKRAEEVLKESEEKYRILVEHSSDLIWNMDIQGNFLYASPSWERVTGYLPSAIIGNNFRLIVHPDDFQICLDSINKVIQTKEIQVSPEYRIRHADGTWHIHSAVGTPVIDKDGVFKSIVAVSRDITDKKSAEEKIQTLLKEKELILKEVHHRVKNNMSTILNLLTLQLDMQDNPQTKGVLFDAAGRVQSMMVLYDKLYRSDNESVLSIKDYFTALVEEIISIFPKKEFVKVVLEIDNIMLNTRILSPLGIIINELITNSMKYAFTGEHDGVITLTVRKKAKSVQIIFRDNGRGLPDSVSFENSTGFGMQLISMLTSQIRGQVWIDRSNGTGFIIEFEI